MDKTLMETKQSLDSFGTQTIDVLTEEKKRVLFLGRSYTCGIYRLHRS
jgi:hypothetical protein